MNNCCVATHTSDRLHVSHFVTKHNKMCSLPCAMTTNKLTFQLIFLLKLFLFIKRISLINKFNFKKCFSENYKRMRLRYCSKATSQTNATFCDLRAHIECNECVLSMRTSLDFRILYAKMNVAKESSTTGCKYIDRFIRRRVFFVNLA